MCLKNLNCHLGNDPKDFPEQIIIHAKGKDTTKFNKYQGGLEF